MPIYEYQCPECGHVFEEWVNITSASNEAPCPQCGQQAVHIISNTAFVLKGGGWYVTDYGSRKSDEHKEGQESSGSATSPAPATPAPTPSPAPAAEASAPVPSTTAPAPAAPATGA